MSRQLVLGESAELLPSDLVDLVGIALSPEQLDAATAPLEPGLVVAGAGTGKTTVMAARVVWLVATGQVAPHEVLGLTFTSKAAAQLAARVRTALRGAGLGAGDGLDADEPGEPTISTYHAFAARLIVEHGLRLGIEPSSRLITDATRYQLAHRVVCRPELPLHELGGPVTTLVGQLLGLDDILAERAVAPEALLAHDHDLVARLAAAPVQQKTGQVMATTARRRVELTRLVLQFRAAKLDRDTLDFADQMRVSAELAMTRPEVGEVLREQFRVVLLDEYQDTSTAQRLLLAHLFGDGHPVTAVGDPLQAIYGWRGASVHNIEAFPEHFPRIGPDGVRHDARRYPLSHNRRSGSAVLEVANEIATRLREEHRGVVPLVQGGPEKGTGRLRCAMLPTYADELAWVADRIAGLKGVVRWADIAVLTRANTPHGHLRDALVARDVPVEVVGTGGLLALPEVIEVVSVLRVLHDPTANPALLRLLTGPRWRIGTRDLAVLGARAAAVAGTRHGPGHEDDVTLDDELDDAVAGSDPVELVSLSDVLLDLGPESVWPFSPEARARLTALGHEVRALRRHVGEPLADLVHRVLAVTGLEVELLARPGDASGAMSASLAAFAELAADFSDIDGVATLGAFLHWLDDADRFAAGPEADDPSDRDAVKIMSVHRSKGLEFPVVVLPFLVDGGFPLRRAPEVWPTAPVSVPHVVRAEPVPPELAGYPPPEGPRQVDADAFKKACQALEQLEELRLGYVAVTRAETWLLASGSSWGPDQKTPRTPGPFLVAVREACLAGAGDIDEWALPPEQGETNPALDAPVAAGLSWPLPLAPDGVLSREQAAALVLARLAALEHPDRPGSDSDSDSDSRSDSDARSGGGPAADARAELPDDPALDPIVAGWDADLRLVRDELERDPHDEILLVPLPASMSASALLSLAEDEQAFASSLARPMPRAPSPAARRGTRFHAWVETLHGPAPMLGDDDLPGAADDDIDSDADLEALREAFLRTPYATATPFAVEAPFSLVLAGRVVNGRIDAVYRREGDDGRERWEVVDWKTNRGRTADPMQLAVYRLAWAEQRGVPLDDVVATFLYVRTAEAVTHDHLPDRADLERLLGPAGP